MSAVTHSSKFSESTTIAVMGKLKKSNNIIKALHERITESVDALEARIVAEPENLTLRSILLEALSIHCRYKCVAKYSYRKLGDDKAKWTATGINKKITNDEGNWMVTIVRNGTGVRVCMTDKLRAEVEQELADKQTNNADYEFQDVKVYK
jgi:hypothetical protein